MIIYIFLFWGHDVNKNNSVPLVETVHIVNARNAIYRMLTHLADGPLKSYVLTNCNHLLSPLSASFDGNPKVIYDLGSKPGLEGPKLHNSNAGVYVFIHKSTSKMYIGSSTSLYSRFKSHWRLGVDWDANRDPKGRESPHTRAKYSKSGLSGDSKFYQYVNNNGGWSNFYWGVLYETTNHILEFAKLYPTTKLESYDVLFGVTLLEARIYEQALLNHYLPSLNSTNNVVFGFVNWEPSAVQGGIKKMKGFGAKVSVEVYNSSYQLLVNFPSKASCCIGLGISVTTFNRYINMNSLVESPKLEMEVYLVRPDKPIIGEKVEFIDSAENIPMITNVNLDALPKTGLIALEKDKTKVFGNYHNAAEAAKLLDNKSEYKYISRYINKERLVLAGGHLLYFVMNPDYKKDVNKRRKPLNPRNAKKVLMIDTLENNTKSFSTIKDLLLFLGYTNTAGTTSIKKYIDGNRLYKGRYKFAYL